MILQSAILALMLLANRGDLVGQADGFAESASGQENGSNESPEITCIITTNNSKWRSKRAVATVSVGIEFQGMVRVSVMPSVHLTALPKSDGMTQNEYWAPFSVATGASTRNWQKLSIPTGKRRYSLRLVPSRLRWASTRSSVWPSQAMAKTVPPGDYSLVVHLETSEGKAVVSNELKITVLK